MKTRILGAFVGLVALLVGGSQSVFAAEDKPFAEQKIVLQISDADSAKQTLVLNVANNLIKFYGQDKVDLEIVAFGGGLPMLFAGNENFKRVQALAASGVKFAACQNTLEGITKQLGYTPELNKDAKLVPAGIVEIIERSKAGFTVVKP